MRHAKTILEGIETALIDQSCDPASLPQLLRDAQGMASTPAAKYKIGEAIALAESANDYSPATIRQHLLNYVVTAMGLVEQGR